MIKALVGLISWQWQYLAFCWWTVVIVFSSIIDLYLKPLQAFKIITKLSKK